MHNRRLGLPETQAVPPNVCVHLPKSQALSKVLWAVSGNLQDREGGLQAGSSISVQNISHFPCLQFEENFGGMDPPKPTAAGGHR